MPLLKAYQQFEQAKKEALDWLRGELRVLRTGRITTEMVESLLVEHYGTRTPLHGVASISAVDARTLAIAPWDPTAIPAIEKALIIAALGVQPIVDGKTIRLSFPAPTDEGRQQTIKMLHYTAEEARVRLRLGRDQALRHIREEKQSGKATEDDFYQGKKKLDEMIDQANKEIATLLKKKEEEIRTV